MLLIGVFGAWAANSSSFVRTKVVPELEVVVPLDEPFELTVPDRTIAPPVTLIDPVEPPFEESAPLIVTA